VWTEVGKSGPIIKYESNCRSAHIPEARFFESRESEHCFQTYSVDNLRGALFKLLGGLLSGSIGTFRWKTAVSFLAPMHGA
jgi:hypothetical protein